MVYILAGHMSFQVKFFLPPYNCVLLPSKALEVIGVRCWHSTVEATDSDGPPPLGVPPSHLWSGILIKIYNHSKLYITDVNIFFFNKYSRLPITRTLANSSLALTQTKIDFPWIFFDSSNHVCQYLTSHNKQCNSQKHWLSFEINTYTSQPLTCYKCLVCCWRLIPII